MRFRLEMDSIKYFTNKLAQSGFTDIVATQIEDNFCHYDVRANWKNQPFRFELKRRNKLYSWFRDTVIEKLKFEELKKYVDNGYSTACYLVTLFNDCFTINNIADSHTEIQRWAEQTTEFNRNKKVLKTFCVYNLSDKKIYRYD